ncbi:reverse transcriptase domain-containing protein [Tanacetum coccineum]
MIPATAPLIGVSGEIIWLIGQILLLVKIGDAEHFTSTWMNFVVVRSPSPYNGIIGRPGVKKIQAVPSTAHGMLKFPVLGGRLTLRSSWIIPLKCTMVSGPEARSCDIIQAAKERIKVAIHPEHPEQTIAIGSTLTEEGRKALSEHRLKVRKGCSPVRQKKRSQALERNKAIQEEVEKLVDTDIMKEVHYHSLLSNPVMVKSMMTAGGFESQEDDSLDAPMETEEELPDPWTLFMDRSSCIDGSEAGLILTNPEGAEFTYALRFRFDATNNEAEYEALIASLRIAEQMGIRNLQENVDSRLVANQHACRNKIHSSKGHTDRILWPTMHVDARKLIRTCQDCQVHRPVPRNPQQEMTPIMSPWSFYKWGIDITGSFPNGPEKVKFLKVAMDYCTTWIEAKPVATITGETEVDMVHNDEALEINLDLLEERREQAAIYKAREAKNGKN